MKEACETLRLWLKNHKDKINIFRYIKSHISDIIVGFTYDKESQDIFYNAMIDSPDLIINIHKELQ
jgi:hypothetical protein